MAAVVATDSSRVNSSTTRTFSCSGTFAATVGRLRKSVVTAAATSSSRARVWIAVIFSCGMTGLTTWRPVRRLASSGVHRALPSGAVRLVAHRSSSSTMPARMLWTVKDTPDTRRSSGHLDAVHLAIFTVEYDSPMSSARRNSESLTVNSSSAGAEPPCSRIGSTSSA